MGQLAKAASRTARDDSGFTLIELLIVASLLAVVLTVTFNALDFADRQAPQEIEYADAISSAESGLQRIMWEIRQAYRVNWTNGDVVTGKGSRIDFNAVIGDVDTEVEFACDQPSTAGSQYYSCVRVSNRTGSALPPLTQGARIIDRLQNTSGGSGAPSVFTFFDPPGTPDPVNPTYVQASIQVPASGPLKYGFKHSITLDNATSIPNLQNGT